MKSSGEVVKQDEDEIKERSRSLRIRAHTLNSRYSKQDYTHRTLSPDIATNMIIHLELSDNNKESEHINMPLPQRSSSTWYQRRFTSFSLEQQQTTSDQHRRMTTGRFSLFDENSRIGLLQQKRPRFLSQMSFARRFSLRKKKHNQDLEQDEAVVDPVYETLKVAAETRKMTLANYLQQRQQTLNKQTSLNSQGSSEVDIQPSPRISRHTSRTDTEINSSLRPSFITTHLSTVQHHQQSQSNASPSLDNTRVTNC